MVDLPVSDDERAELSEKLFLYKRKLFKICATTNAVIKERSHVDVLQGIQYLAVRDLFKLDGKRQDIWHSVKKFKSKKIPVLSDSNNRAGLGKTSSEWSDCNNLMKEKCQAIVNFDSYLTTEDHSYDVKFKYDDHFNYLPDSCRKFCADLYSNLVSRIFSDPNFLEKFRDHVKKDTLSIMEKKKCPEDSKKSHDALIAYQKGLSCITNFYFVAKNDIFLLGRDAFDDISSALGENRWIVDNSEKPGVFELGCFDEAHEDIMNDNSFLKLGDDQKIASFISQFGEGLCSPILKPF